MTYKTPGVYIKEISTLPPTVSQVETAIPAFIGYTEKALDENGQEVTKFPYVTRIKSFKDYEERFGYGANVYVDSAANDAPKIQIISGTPDTLSFPTTLDATNKKFKMYYALQIYFANGGGPCYICSTGKYGDSDFTDNTDFGDGLTKIGKEDEPTILLFPDAGGLAAGYYDLYKEALIQCANLGDRVTLVDVKSSTTLASIETDFRTNIGNNNLKYGMAYYPSFQSSLTYYYDEHLLKIKDGATNKILNLLPTLPAVSLTPAQEATSVFHSNNTFYHQIKAELAKQYVELAPSAAIAGIYAFVDSNRGVWKAPANVSINGVKKLLVDIDDEDQKDMNDTSSGKSVNAIRNFYGKGTIVWGARTLDGNSGEWRYIPVRRFYNMAEESIKKATEAFVFEPNDANTWVKVRAMIENFLFNQWRAGALAGPTPEAAYYVRVGLGETMTTAEINAGIMNVEIGMAVVRPAEFIILKFSHKMQEA